MSIRALYCAILLASFALAGCAHLGQRVERGAAPAVASQSALHDILADLSANEAALRTLKASGSLTIKTPQSAAVQQCGGSIQFRKPSDLYVVGRGPLGGKEFELRCVGDRYLIWHNGESQIGEGAKEVEGISWKVSPSEIVREMFIPELWSALDARDARLVEYDEARHNAVLVIGPEKHPRRRVEVTGPPWDVTKNELFDPATGDVVASTELNDYRTEAGVRFPRVVDARFPKQETRLTFTIRDQKLNTQLDDSRFTIEEADTK